VAGYCTPHRLEVLARPFNGWTWSKGISAIHRAKQCRAFVQCRVLEDGTGHPKRSVVVDDLLYARGWQILDETHAEEPGEQPAIGGWAPGYILLTIHFTRHRHLFPSLSLHRQDLSRHISVVGGARRLMHDTHPAALRGARHYLGSCSML
jgi:hypothetical protein